MVTVEVWEWMSNFITHFTGYVIIRLKFTQAIQGMPVVIFYIDPRFLYIEVGK